MSEEQNRTLNLSELANAGSELTSQQPTPPSASDVPVIPESEPQHVAPTTPPPAPHVPVTRPVDDTHVYTPQPDGSLVRTDAPVEISAQPAPHQIQPTTVEPDSLGFVVEKPAAQAEAAPTETQEMLKEMGIDRLAGGLPKDLGDTLNEYLKEVAEDTETIGKVVAERGYVAPEGQEQPTGDKNKDEDSDEDDDAASDDPVEVQEKFLEGYAQAVVHIDKTGMGSVLFSADEQEKLDRARRIKLTEVEEVDLGTIRVKKAKKKQLKTIIQRQLTVHEATVVLPASGYTAVVRGCSTYELVALMDRAKDRLIDSERKWTLIHSKIVTTSLGNMDFNTFLKNTAGMDYNMFIYGLLVATYPQDDVIPINCPHCGKRHEHKYTVPSLIRAEKMSAKFQELVGRIVDHSHTLEDAQVVHGESLINQVKRIRLPISNIIVDLYIQTAYDLIYNSIKALDKIDETREQAAFMATTVKTFYMQDPDSDDPNDYVSYDETPEIAEIIFNLVDKDFLVLTNQASAIMEDSSFEFGLMDITCPHCKKYTESLPFDLESILFYQNQQTLTTESE